MEICIDNVWGTVCNDSWGDNDARVVCRQSPEGISRDVIQVESMLLHVIASSLPLGHTIKDIVSLGHTPGTVTGSL